MSPSRHRVRRVVVAVACLALASRAAAAPPGRTQSLEYRVAWNGIPAAHAHVTVTPGEVLGRPTLVVEASAHTNALVSLFWSFSGRVRSTMLAGDLSPLHFDYRRELVGRPYATTIDFAGDEAHSVYVKGDRRSDLDVVADDLLDPITAVFRARFSDAGPGDSLTYDVWTGEVRYLVRLDIAASAPVEVPAGRFAALEVVPKLWRIEGRAAPDTRLRRATVWVSDDPEHVLLRIRSKVFVGAVTLDLVAIDPGGA